MHDIDRTQLESESEAFEGEQFEFAFEGVSEMWGETDTESPFTEVEEMELAAELLGVNSEAELNHFLGNLIRRGAQAAGKFIKSPTGQALGGILKGAARQALPVLGRAVGTYFGGPAGGAAGSQLASAAGRVFGLELEGLSQEDQEFEAARRFVRFGGAASKRAASAPPSVNPRAAARRGAMQAARRHAPGLLRKKRPGTGLPPQLRRRIPAAFPQDYAAGAPDHSGRWFRRGPNIVIVNCAGGAPTSEPSGGPSAGEPSAGQPMPQGGEGGEGGEEF